MNAHRHARRATLFLVGLLLAPAAASQTQHVDFFGPARPELRSFPIPQAILECDRAIDVLTFGLSQHWTTRAQYIAAVERSEKQGTAGDDLGKVREAIVVFLKAQLHDHRIWDEKPGLDAEVRHSISILSEERDALLERERKAASGSRPE